jgi:hypothetical protein
VYNTSEVSVGIPVPSDLYSVYRQTTPSRFLENKKLKKEERTKKK